MYGSVSRWRIKDGKGPELERLFQEVINDAPASSRGLTVYRSEADPNEVWVAGVFESKEAYRANAQTPEQNARFTRLRELMASDPEWHDGEVVAHR